jgi:two-component system sensor kinase FixL
MGERERPDPVKRELETVRGVIDAIERLRPESRRKEGPALFADLRAHLDRLEWARELTIARSAIAGILAEAGSPLAATPSILRTICRVCRWEAGELWASDRNTAVLRFAGRWKCRSLPARFFAARGWEFLPLDGGGFIARVFKSREPAWIDVPPPSSDFPHLASNCEMRTVLGFPILLGREPLGVLAFYARSSDRRPPADGDRTLLMCLEAIAGQIARSMEKTAAQEKLRLSEGRLRRLAGSIPDLFSEVDTGGRRIFASASYKRVLGWDPEQLLGKPIFDLLHPDDVPRMMALFLEVKEGKKEGRIESRLRHADGHHVWIESIGTPILSEDGGLEGWAILGRDITAQKTKEALRRKSFEVLERRVEDRTFELTRTNEILRREAAERQRAEEASRRNEERYLAILGAIPDIIFRIRGDGTFLDFKPSALFVPFKPPAEFLGKRVQDVLPPDVARSSLALIRKALDGRRMEVHEYSLPIGNETRMYESRLIPFGDDEVMVITRDVSEKSRAAEEERRHREELAHVSRLATVGEMASTLAHELSQPLAAISTFTDTCARLIRSGGRKHKEILDALDKVAAQATRAGDVIRGLRGFMGRSDPDRTPADLNQLVLEAVRLAEGDLRTASVDVRLALADSLPPVLVNKIQIEQVILNLVRNAAEALAGSPSDEKDLLVQTFLAGDEVEVAVRDRGPGLAPEISDHLFEPFQTTKAGGMGMGLAISRRIAVAHKGRLGMTPNEGCGLTFFLRLPVTSGRA